MPSIKTTVDIHASAEVVWRVLTDFPEYGKWHPLFASLQGKLSVGKRLKLRARDKQKRDHQFTPLVVKVVPAAELRWRRWRLLEGVFDREQIFLIVPNGVKGVRFVQREKFSGLLVSLLMPIVAKKTLKAIMLVNLAIKRAAEVKR